MKLYIDRSLVSNRTRRCVLNMETSSTTTILIWFPQVTWTWHLLQCLHLNLVYMSWKHCGKFGLVVSVKHQQRLDMCNDKYYCAKSILQKNYMQQKFFLFLHLHAVIPVSVSKYQAYPQEKLSNNGHFITLQIDGQSPNLFSSNYITKAKNGHLNTSPKQIMIQRHHQY